MTLICLPKENNGYVCIDCWRIQITMQGDLKEKPSTMAQTWGSSDFVFLGGIFYSLSGIFHRRWILGNRKGKLLRKFLRFFSSTPSLNLNLLKKLFHVWLHPSELEFHVFPSMSTWVHHYLAVPSDTLVFNNLQDNTKTTSKRACPVHSLPWSLP